MLAYVHAVLGALTVALLFAVGWPPLRERARRAPSAGVVRRHGTRAPLLLPVAAAAWLSGLVSTWLWRADLDPAASLHFRIGLLLLLLLAGNGWIAAAMRRGDDRWRELHPWIGATALLLAAGQTVSGLQLLP